MRNSFSCSVHVMRINSAYGYEQELESETRINDAHLPKFFLLLTFACSCIEKLRSCSGTGVPV